MYRYRQSRVRFPLSRLGIWLLASLSLGFSLTIIATRSPRSKAGRAAHSAGLIPESSHTESQKNRKNYPYSVIPGGVENAEELRSAINADQVVAEHYKGFEVSRAVQIRMTEDRPAYVSYRIGKHIFWTARPIIVKQDERVLTDGSRFVRTRCGNQISFVRQAPVNLAEEPDEYAMDFIPDLPSMPVSYMESVPGQTPPARPVPEPVVVPIIEAQPVQIASKPRRRHRRVDATTPVPEPSTWLSFGGGAVFLYWLSSRWKK